MKRETTNKFVKIYRLYLKPVLKPIGYGLGFILMSCMTFLFVFGIMAVITAVDAWLLVTLWPMVIPVLFPGLVASGSVAGAVGFETMFWALVGLFILKPTNISKLFTKKGEKQ